MTITYDEALREQVRSNLSAHNRRVVTDPTKQRAAVAVVLVDFMVGEHRVDPAPVDDWIDGREMPKAGLDGRMDINWEHIPEVGGWSRVARRDRESC